MVAWGGKHHPKKAALHLQIRFSREKSLRESLFSSKSRSWRQFNGLFGDRKAGILERKQRASKATSRTQTKPTKRTKFGALKGASKTKTPK
jgi:hypothetical protein